MCVVDPTNIAKAVLKEELEDTKGVIRIRISKNRQQWSKANVQKDKQRFTKHTHKAKYRVTRTPLKTGGELRCSGRVSSCRSTSAIDCFRICLYHVIC